MSSIFSTAQEMAQKAVEVPMKVVNTALDTTQKTTAAVGTAVTGVTENVGKTATSATGVVANTVETLETVSERIKKSTIEMSKRRAEIEREKTASQVGKTAQEIARIENETNEKLKKLEQDYELTQKKMKEEQDLLMQRVNANYETVKLEQLENQKIMAMCYAYGFKQNKSPYTPGVNQTSIYYSTDKVWYYSYVPVSFVTESNKFVELELPKKEINQIGERGQKIQVIDKQTGKPVTIYFERVLNQGYLWDNQTYKPVIVFEESTTEVQQNTVSQPSEVPNTVTPTIGGITDGELTNTKEKGTLYFSQEWFYVMRDVKVGGSGVKRRGSRGRSRRRSRRTSIKHKTRRYKRMSRRHRQSKRRRI